ncbi:hypothetical protein HYPSUDRAFT_250083 [Hypholoma sublateritium FD-334 SS-4]|uniref:Uncharacterized protein n=1 Tax=Hypholoma sublateritium (strain FD-334 SS-4) TaxID=945553 RepID=A0A0D2PP49_HYPSF|nr:hypothetical protein HYPSUDRAFT_250083 [Hypholoma sublateritium FD-334 SS-4]
MEQLSTILNRNKDQFITEYIHEQRQYRQIYASAGQVERNTWDTPKAGTAHSDSLSCSQMNKADDFVFNTPILQARTVKRRDSAESALPKRRSDHSDDRRTKLTGEQRTVHSRNAASESFNTLSTHSMHHDKTAKRLNAISGPKSSKAVHSPKRSVYESSSGDDEQKNRLAERRQRKKAKKSIMKPEIKTGNDKAQERGSKKTRESGAQAGFALMHGFSATNVGKNRLTLDYLTSNINSGVFRKGKASDATKVNGSFSKKPPRRREHFVESAFLNAKRKKQPPSTQIRSPTPSSFCGTSQSDLTTEEQRKFSQIRSQETRGESPERVPLEPSPRENEIRPKYNPDDSVIWDIERTSSLCVSQSSSNHGQGTILVSFPKIIKSKETGVSHGLMERPTRIPGSSAEPLKAASSMDILGQLGSTVSLGPSQSASQVVKAAPCPNETSGYFNSARKPLDTGKSAVSIPPANIVKEMLVESVDPRSLHTVEDTARNAPMAVTAVESVLFDDGYAELPSTGSRAYLSGFDASHLTTRSSRNPELEHVNSYWSEIAWGELDTGRADDLFEHDGFSTGLSDQIDFDAGDALSPILEILPVWERGLEFFCEEDYVHCDENRNPGADYMPVEMENLYDFVVPETFVDGLGSPEDQSPSYFFLPAEFSISDKQEDLSVVCENSYRALSDISAADISYVETDEGQCSPEADNFYQGRLLLHGFSAILSSASPGTNALSATEAEVAGLLKRNHWLPQKL